MLFDPDLHHRRSVRLKDYDYSRPGMYFVTICSQNMLCIFGDIVGERVILNTLGEIVEKEWMATADKRDYIELDLYVIMPNHFHGVVTIRDDSRRDMALCSATT
jgi:REP element-mobilizing transposase RayT